VRKPVTRNPRSKERPSEPAAASPRALAECATACAPRFDLAELARMPGRTVLERASQRRVRVNGIRRLATLQAAQGSPSGAPAYAATGPPNHRPLVEQRFLLDAIGYRRDLTDVVGWDSEYARGEWLLRRLGYPGRDRAIDFGEIEPIWLRELTKRWARWRLSVGTALATAIADVRAITRFAQSFPHCAAAPRR